MILKTYGIFDGVSGEYVRTFVAGNDDEAKRAAEYIVRDKGFDDISGKDRSIHHLYNVDTGTGQVVDNSVYMICNLSTYIENRKREEVEKEVKAKVLTEDFIKQLKDELLETLKGQLLDVRKEAHAN